MKQERTVSVLGTGRMGSAMATTLVRSGFKLVVWNRDEVKAKALGSSLGVDVAGTASEAASRSSVVLTSLADDQAVKAVYLDSDGVVAGVGPESIVIDTSTVDPLTTDEVGAAIDAVGAAFLDCPVSGSVSAVDSGSLTIMAGGDADDLRRAKPVLDALSVRVIHTGRRGTGAATKLAVNGLVHGLNLALSEALVLAERAGIDRLTAYEVFASGAGGAPFVHYKRAAFEHPETAPIAFTLDLVGKDLELITGLAQRVGAPVEQAEKGLEIVKRAIAAGFGERDLSALADFLRDA